MQVTIRPQITNIKKDLAGLAGDPKSLLKSRRRLSTVHSEIQTHHQNTNDRNVEDEDEDQPGGR